MFLSFIIYRRDYRPSVEVGHGRENTLVSCAYWFSADL
jgi:hypothetical protein